MEPMTAAEIADYDARRARIARFKVLSGTDFAAAEYASDLIAKAVPGAVISHGGHVDRYVETLIWHTPDGGWEALTIDPSINDNFCLSWPDSDWHRRSTFFFDSMWHDLLVHADTPTALAVALTAAIGAGDDLDAALTLLVSAVPAEQQSALARDLTAAGANLLAPGVFENHAKPVAA